MSCSVSAHLGLKMGAVMAKRKMHWALFSETSICGETNRPQFARDQGAVTCGRCRRLLGLVPEELRNLIDPELIARLVIPLPKGKALDSLIGRAFKDTEGQLANLLKLANDVVSEFDTALENGENTRVYARDLADVLRKFINLLEGEKP